MDSRGISKLLIVIVALVLLLVVAGGAVTYLLLFRHTAPPTPQQLRPDARKTYVLDQFRVNVAGSDYSQFLMATMYIGYSDEKLATELDERKPQIHDIVNNILSSWTLDEFTNDNDRKKLKTEIKRQINAVLKTGTIDDVYITELIIQ